jgi:branched-chain amino acid transport system substrate-binding protein
VTLRAKIVLIANRDKGRIITMAFSRRILIGAALAAVICSPVWAQETLKIGAIGSLSGGGTAWGLAIKRGAELALDEVNKAGGLKVGDKTYKLELVMYDDQYTGQGGKTAAERLVYQDKVKYIIGPIGSNPVLSTVEVTTPQKVVLLSNGYTSKILDNDHKASFNFRFTLTNLEYAPSMMKWVKANLKVTKVGLLVPNDAIGQSVAPPLVKLYKENGIEPVVDYYERGSKEFSPLITRMMAAGIDGIDLNFSAPGEAGLILKQARQIGFNKVIYQMGGPSVPEIMEVAGKQAEGFISYEMFSFTTPTAQPFVKAYAAKYGAGIINSQTPAFYNATKILIEALRRAGTVDDTTKIRDTIEKMEGYDAGIYGPLRWTGKALYRVDHQIALPFYVVEVKDGNIVMLTTLSVD